MIKVMMKFTKKYSKAGKYEETSFNLDTKFATLIRNTCTMAELLKYTSKSCLECFIMVYFILALFLKKH